MSSGSSIFQTAVVKTDEYLLLASVMKANGSTTQQISLEIEAIDNMLSMQRIRSIISSRRFTSTGRIRKDSSLTNMIDKRLDQLVQELKEV